MQANQAKARGPNTGFTNSRALWAIAYKANTLKLVPTIVCGLENSQNALTQLCGPEAFLSIQDFPIASLLINIKCPQIIFTHLTRFLALPLDDNSKTEPHNNFRF